MAYKHFYVSIYGEFIVSRVQDVRGEGDYARSRVRRNFISRGGGG